MKSENDKNLDIALWRYGLISPFLHRDANDLTFGKMLDHSASASLAGQMFSCRSYISWICPDDIMVCIPVTTTKVDRPCHGYFRRLDHGAVPDDERGPLHESHGGHHDLSMDSYPCHPCHCRLDTSDFKRRIAGVTTRYNFKQNIHRRFRKTRVLSPQTITGPGLYFARANTEETLPMWLKQIHKINWIVILMVLMSSPACAQGPMTRLKMSQSSDRTVCNCYNSDRYWEMAQDEMRQRKLSREQCIRLIEANKRPVTRTYIESPPRYFYDEPDVIFYDDDDDDVIVIEGDDGMIIIDEEEEEMVIIDDDGIHIFD